MSVALVDNLVEAVRIQLDEANTADLTTDKILATLNRAQVKLVRLATRHYAPVFRRESNLSVNAGTREVSLPATTFGLIVNEVDVIKNGQAFKVDVADLSTLTSYDSQSSSALPIYYACQGNLLKLFPTPQQPVIIRVRYQIRPPELVLQQGRVVAFDGTAMTAELDSLGPELTTSIAALGAFVNWVEGTTGTVRATLQVASLDADTSTVTFKTVGLGRATVFGQTVATTLPTDAALDDYLTLANGTCLPTLLVDYYDYLVQFAVCELRRKQGEDVTQDLAALRELEDDVKAMWAGRQTVRRVRKANTYWGARLPLISRYT